MTKQESVAEPQDDDAFERFREITRKVLTTSSEAYREFAEREKQEKAKKPAESRTPQASSSLVPAALVR